MKLLTALVHRGVYRAGWPESGTRRIWPGWLRLGPWVIGNTYAWDRSDAP